MRHESSFNIRTFHTDAFGHINNARYLEILEEARWQYAEEIGLIELLRESELGFIIMDLRIQFRRPVTEGDSICVQTQLITLGTASGEVLQKVSRVGEEKLSTRCLSHFILIERETGRSVPIDGPIRQRLEEVIQPECASVRS